MHATTPHPKASVDNQHSFTPPRADVDAIQQPSTGLDRTTHREPSRINHRGDSTTYSLDLHAKITNSTTHKHDTTPFNSIDCARSEACNIPQQMPPPVATDFLIYFHINIYIRHGCNFGPVCVRIFVFRFRFLHHPALETLKICCV